MSTCKLIFHSYSEYDNILHNVYAMESVLMHSEKNSLKNIALLHGDVLV